MAKCSYQIKGDFNFVCRSLKQQILDGSTSATLEEEEYRTYGDLRIGIMVFERYSYSGGNRLSLNVTVIEHLQHIDIIGISAGGSNALFFKVNTWGEEAFLDKLKEAIVAISMLK